MVAVPHTLKGKTILDAHQWVVSQIDGRNEYTLTGDMGQPATLSDLTTGKFTEVNIMPQGARSNPAPSYAFKPSHQPQKRIQQFSSRVLLPDGLSPSLIHALEAKHGSAYRFIASKMLAQRSRRGYLSPKGHRMLDSMVMADPISPVLSNPIGLRRTPSGLRLARVIGDRGRVMDDAIMQEVRSYLNEGDIPHNIAASEEQFEQFRTHVLQPYMISIGANMELIRYLNETLIPHMNRLIDNGAFTSSAFEAQGILKFTKAKAKAGAGKSELKKAISERYNTVVRRLATSPQDFYAGRNEALIAHPAFMYPQARFMLLPPPEKLTGGSRAELFLYQAGEPPRYGVSGDNGIVQQLPQRVMTAALKAQERTAPEGIVFPIARVNNAPAVFAETLNATNVSEALRNADIGGLITMASRAFYNTDALRRIIGLGAATPPGGLTSEEQGAIAELNQVVNQINANQGMETLRAGGGFNAETIGLAAAIEINISGIRPRPIGWPEGLIMAMMQVVGENVEQLTNRGFDGGDSSFFIPHVEAYGLDGRIRLSAPNTLDNTIQHLSDGVKNQVNQFFAEGITLDDLVRDSNGAGEVNRTYAASIALHLATNVGAGHGAMNPNTIPRNAGERNGALTNFKNLPQNPTEQAGENDARVVKFTHIQRKQNNNGQAPGQISLLGLMQQALNRFKEQGGSPTPEEVTFVMQLLAYSLANLNANVVIEDGIMDALAEALRAAQDRANEGRDEAFTNLIAQFDERRGEIPEEAALQRMVMDRVIEGLLDEILAGGDVADFLAGGAFGDLDFDDEGNPILANPRRNPPIENIASLVGDSKDLDAIRRARDALRQNRKANRFGRGNIEAFLPDEATVQALSERLRDVFREALAATQAEREEAQRVMARNQLIEARLGNMAQIENRRNEMTAFQRTIRHIHDVLTELINHEEEYVRGYMRVPDDPFMELDNNISREQMMNHPLYNAQMLHGQHEMFMRHISNVENQVRSALRIVQGQIARMGGGLGGDEQMEFGIRANENLLEYYAQAIEFCNGLQEAYGEVGGFLNRAIEDMRTDDPDNLSVNLYLALFDVADNFMIRSGVRAGLRMSAETVSSPVNPVRNEVVFNEITEKCFNIIADLFGAFPGNIPAHPPNRILQLGTDYLMALINANLGFGGDREDEMQRDEIIQQTVAGPGWEQEAMERQRQRFYRDRLRQERAEEVAARDVFSTRNMARAASIFDMADEVSIQQALEARRQRAGSLFKRAGEMGMTSEAYERTQRRLMSEQEEREAQEAFDKQMRIDMWKIALTTPGSEVRNALMQKKMELELEIGQPYEEVVSPEDQAYNFHVLANGIALQSMLELGEISQAMFDRAKRQKLPVDSVRNMLKGAAKGRAAQVKQRYEKALLKAVQDVVAVQQPTFETEENLTNDAYVQYMMRVSEEDLAYGSPGPALDRLTGEGDYEVDLSPNRFGMDAVGPSAGTGDYFLFNPPEFEMDVLNKRGDVVRTVGAEMAAILMRDYGFERRGMDLVPREYDATQQLLDEVRQLAATVDKQQSRYDSQPFQRGMGQIPAYGAQQLTPMADGRARGTSRGPAISWSEGAAAPAPSARRPVSKPMGRGAFAPRLNGKVVNWLD